MALASLCMLSTLGCGALIGLDDFESDDGGSDGSGGTDTGGGPGISCTDDQDPGSIDEGCTTATPACDDTSKTCFECVVAADCGPGALCNAPTCTDHRCGTAPAAGGTVELMNSTTLNGSFEETVPVSPPTAEGWTEEGYDAGVDSAYDNSQLTLRCSGGEKPVINFNCISKTLLAYDGYRMAWLGPYTDADPATPDTGDDALPANWLDRLTSPPLTLPAGTTTVRVIAAMYIYTEETELSVSDTTTVRLVNSDGDDIVVGSRSNLDASETVDTWTEFGFDETIDLPAAWAGTEVTLVLSSENDDALVTAFGYDDLKVVAGATCE